MGAIGIHLIGQTAIGGGVQRTTQVALPPGLNPIGTYWFGVRLPKANKEVTRLTIGSTDVLALPPNPAVAVNLKNAYPNTNLLFRGYEVPAALLPPLYPNFVVYFSLQVATALQQVMWNVVQKPSAIGGGFNSGAPEARGQSDIHATAVRKARRAKGAGRGRKSQRYGGGGRGKKKGRRRVE